MANEFYVYAYMDNDTPYYVGKGKGMRAYKGKHTVPIPANPQNIVMYKTGLNEDVAFTLERFWITVYGRQNNNTGILLNKKPGGDGASGYKHTPASRAKMSLSHRGKPAWNKGLVGCYTQSEEANKKRSAATKCIPRPSYNRRPYTEEELVMRSNRQRDIWAMRKGEL